MSHFVVMVIGDDAEKQLEKYDESLELPPYIKHTKDELVALKRKEIEDYRNTVYAKYLENKELYKQGCENERHIEYLENEFPQKLHWSDEQVYQDAIKYSEIDEKGNVISTYNPDAKWDWYVRGGRWAGYLWLKEGTEPLVPVNFSWGWSEEEKQKDETEQNSGDGLCGNVSGEIKSEEFKGWKGCDLEVQQAKCGDGGGGRQSVFCEKGKCGYYRQGRQEVL